MRAIATSWIAEPTLGHLEAIRRCEFELALTLLPSGGRLLEIGAGTGWQARAFETRGFDVSGIDLATSNYRDARVWPVTDYDGVHVPFSDGTFDVVFSSNTLEHVPHVRAFQREIHRVLAPGGIALHLVPSASWALWSIATHLVKFWTLPPVHGEHAKSLLVEATRFRRGWWARLFRETGWSVEYQGPNNIFYTGCSIMDARLGMRLRSRLKLVLGSSCHVYLLRRSRPA